MIFKATLHLSKDQIAEAFMDYLKRKGIAISSKFAVSAEHIEITGVWVGRDAEHETNREGQGHD